MGRNTKRTSAPDAPENSPDDAPKALRRRGAGTVAPRAVPTSTLHETLEVAIELLCGGRHDVSAVTIHHVAIAPASFGAATRRLLPQIVATADLRDGAVRLVRAGAADGIGADGLPGTEVLDDHDFTDNIGETGLRGACADADDDVWFPLQPDDEGYDADVVAAQNAVAVDVCSRCASQVACRNLGLRGSNEVGTWGGLTERERKRWRNEIRRRLRLHHHDLVALRRALDRPGVWVELMRKSRSNIPPTIARLVTLVPPIPDPARHHAHGRWIVATHSTSDEGRVWVAWVPDGEPGPAWGDGWRYRATLRPPEPAAYGVTPEVAARQNQGPSSGNVRPVASRSARPVNQGSMFRWVS